jgi:hypothetical protein
VSGTLLAIGLLVVVGLLPAWALIARPLEALLAGPLLGALVLVPGAVVAVATAGPLLPWTVLGVVAANLVAWQACRPGRGAPRWAPSGSAVPVVVVAGVVSVVVAAHVSRAPVDWDAHSIWLYHSGWFARGGDVARDAFRLETFSHAEYPPLLAAAAGSLSGLVRRELDWRIAQVVIAATGWSAFATAAAVLIDGAKRQWVTAVGVLGIAAVGVAQLGFAVANAEADLAAATTVLLAAAALLVRDDPRLVPLGLAAATAAALCKGESMVTAFVVVGLAWWRQGRPAEVRWATPLLAGLGWTVLARALGAESFVTRDYGGVSAERIVDRAWPSLVRLGEELGRPAVAAAVASIGCALLVARSRRALALVWAVAAADVAGLVLIYLVGGFDIQAWLDSSARRVATGPVLLVAMAAVLSLDRCADLAVSGAGRDPAPTSSPPRGDRSPASTAPRSTRRTPRS